MLSPSPTGPKPRTLLGQAARIEDNVETIGRASQQLLKTLNLALGEFARAEI
jgi:hypothetical protein